MFRVQPFLSLIFVGICAAAAMRLPTAACNAEAYIDNEGYTWGRCPAINCDVSSPCVVGTFQDAGVTWLYCYCVGGQGTGGCLAAYTGPPFMSRCYNVGCPGPADCHKQVPGPSWGVICKCELPPEV